MPIIPKLDTRISTDVPNIRVQTDSSISEAVADVGSQFLQITNEIDNRLVQSEAVTAASRAQFDDNIAAQDKIRELSLKYPSGYVKDEQGRDVRSISEEFYAWSNERYKANSTKMPTRLAQDMYNEAATKFFTSSFMGVKNEEFKLRRDFKINDRNNRIQTGKNVMSSSTPLVPHPTIPGKQVVSPKMALEMFDSFDREIVADTGVLLSVPESVKMRADIGETLGTHFYETVYTAALGAPKTGTTRAAIVDEALASLRGEDPEQMERKKRGLPTLPNMMSPEKHEEITRRLLALRDQVKQADLSDLRAKHSAAMTDLREGRAVNLGPLIQEGFSAYKGGQLTDFEWVQFASEPIAWQEGMGVFRSADYLLGSETKKEAIKAEAIEKIFNRTKSIVGPEFFSKYNYAGAELRKNFKAQLDSIDSARQKQFKTDAIQWADEVIPTASALSSKIAATKFLANPAIAKPEHFQLLDRRRAEIIKPVHGYTGTTSYNLVPLKDSEIPDIKGFINSGTTSSDIVARGLKNMSQGTKLYPQVIEQLVEGKHINPGYRFTMYAGNRTDKMTAIVQAVKSSENINELRKSLKDGDEVYKKVRENVAKYSMPFFTERLQMNPNNPAVLDEISRMNDVITAHALLQMRTTPDANKEEISRQAVEYLMGDRVPVQGAIRGRPVSFPMMSNGQAPSEEEKNYLERRMKTLMVDAKALESKYGAALSTVDSKGREGQTFDAFWSDVNASAHYVRDHNGNYNITYRNYEGVLVRLLTGKRDKFGNPIPVTIPASDLNYPVRDDERTLWDRFLGRAKDLVNQGKDSTQTKENNDLSGMQ